MNIILKNSHTNIMIKFENKYTFYGGKSWKEIKKYIVQ